MGGDGGAYVVLIAKSNILLNGTLNFRSGQLSNGNCILASAGGGGGAGVGGAGGSGAANRVANCAATSGSSGGVGYAGLGQPGGTGGNGGAGAGGSVVIAGYDLALAGSTINVSGGLNNGGTIKLLYANTLQNNGSYDGQSSLVVSKINDDWFQAPPDAELMARTAILQGANTSVLGANYAYFSDHWLAIRLANGTQYAARFDLFIKSGNKRWAFNYDPNNAGALPAFANITPVLYVWQRINLTSSNITNDVSAFINNTN
jgi:hypothetical protein